MVVSKTLARLQLALPAQGVRKAGNSFQTLVCRRHEEVDVVEANGDGAEAGHRVDENARRRLESTNDSGDAFDVVDNAGTRLAMNDGHQAKQRTTAELSSAVLTYLRAKTSNII